jgi:glucuronosyltransferase
MKLSLFTVIVLICAHSSHCAKILAYFPTPSISHQVVFHALVKDLAARGHELTVLTTDLIKIDNPNVTQIDLHSSYDVFRREFNFVDFKKSGTDEIGLMDFFFPIMLKFLEEQFTHPEVKKLIDESDRRHFDLVIIEHLAYTPIMGFAEIYNCPMIGITSLDTMNENHERIGNAANPVLHPEMLFSFIQGPLTFEERWRALKYYVKHNYYSQKRYDVELRKFIRKYLPNVTLDLEALKRRVEFVMVNTHPALGYSRPILPNTIQLGFMHIEEPKPLKDGELKTFLDNSEHGVIYMSLGSNVQSKDLGPEITEMLLKVFGSLKYDVLWKFESDHLPNKPKNVMIQKWLPQADLLAHHKIKLFITQGGQQSMEETIDRGVPTVVVPFLADQDGNAKRMEQRQFGKHLELHTLTEEKLRSTIIEMVKPVYKENILKFRELVYDQPMTSREKAVWWTEYVIRHKGASHLAYTGVKVPVYQKYFLDFAAIAVIAVTVFLISIMALIRKLSQTPSQGKKKSD